MPSIENKPEAKAPPPVVRPDTVDVAPPSVDVPVKRYYGRKKDDHSDSELSYSDDETDKKGQDSREGDQKSECNA